MAYTANWESDEPARSELDSSKGPLLVEFGAVWCPHCQAIQPELKAILADLPEVRHVKIEDGKGKPLGRSFRVKLWPNLVVMHDGQVLEQLARPSAQEMRSALQAVRRS